MLSGKTTIDVDASPEDCFGLVSQLDRYPEWQSQVRRAEILERDGDGRPLVVETTSDARVREITYRLRYAYDEPSRMSWTYVEGDMKDVNGEYRFEPLGGGRTRVTFRLHVDPGRRLGLLLRGPIADKVRDYVLGQTLHEFKSEVEGG